MKEFITIKKMDDGDYQRVGNMDHRFFVLTRVCNDDYFDSGCLIAWLQDKTKDSLTNEWVSIEKHGNKIVLFDRTDEVSDEDDYNFIHIIQLDPAKSFEMERKNFEEVVQQWEELRVSAPDIILVVIHEDNHVSLEVDPQIIKEYQDAGYAFDYDKRYSSESSNGK